VAVTIKVSLLWIILITAAVFILLPFFCDNRSGGHDFAAMRTWLKDHLYTQADPVSDPKPDHLPPGIKAGATQTVTGEGLWIPATTYTPEDTIAVELTEVTLGDDTHWVKVVIDGTEVKWQRLQYYHADIERRWRGFVEVTNCESSRFGVGIGYKLFTVLGSDVVPSASVSTNLDWVAGEVQLSRTIWSGIGAGIGVGYRFHDTDDGLHISGLISIEL